MRRAAAWAGLMALAGAAAAQEVQAPRVVAALNQNRIAITADFDGAELFVYGAIDRAAPAAADDGLGVVVRIAGPSTPVVVRRKERAFGIWINQGAETIDAAPSFYAIAATGAFEDTLSHTEDLRFRVSLEHALRLVGARSAGEERLAYLDAVVRLKAAQGLYAVQPGGVALVDDTLFSATFQLPANLVEGVYHATVLLTRNREVIDAYEAEIDVAKAGLERWLFELARDRPALYGALALAVALAAGLAASEAFRALRR